MGTLLSNARWQDRTLGVGDGPAECGSQTLGTGLTAHKRGQRPVPRGLCPQKASLKEPRLYGFHQPEMQVQTLDTEHVFCTQKDLGKPPNNIPIGDVSHNNSSSQVKLALKPSRLVLRKCLGTIAQQSKGKEIGKRRDCSLTCDLEPGLRQTFSTQASWDTTSTQTHPSPPSLSGSPECVSTFPGSIIHIAVYAVSTAVHTIIHTTVHTSAQIGAQL